MHICILSLEELDTISAGVPRVLSGYVFQSLIKLNKQTRKKIYDVYSDKNYKGDKKTNLFNIITQNNVEISMEDRERIHDELNVICEEQVENFPFEAETDNEPSCIQKDEAENSSDIEYEENSCLEKTNLTNRKNYLITKKMSIENSLSYDKDEYTNDSDYYFVPRFQITSDDVKQKDRDISCEISIPGDGVNEIDEEEKEELELFNEYIQNKIKKRIDGGAKRVEKNKLKHETLLQFAEKQEINVNEMELDERVIANELLKTYEEQQGSKGEAIATRNSEIQLCSTQLPGLEDDHEKIVHVAHNISLKKLQQYQRALTEGLFERDKRMLYNEVKLKNKQQKDLCRQRELEQKEKEDYEKYLRQERQKRWNHKNRAYIKNKEAEIQSAKTDLGEGRINSETVAVLRCAMSLFSIDEIKIAFKFIKENNLMNLKSAQELYFRKPFCELTWFEKWRFNVACTLGKQSVIKSIVQSADIKGYKVWD